MDVSPANMADRIGVMYAGKLMEYGTTEEVFEKRYHPYTNQLINATPSLHLPVSQIKSIEGNPPNMLDLPSGCPFSPRCLKVMEICKQKNSDDYNVKENHIAKCHLYGGGNC